MTLHYSSLHFPLTVIKSDAIAQGESHTYFVHSFHEPLSYDSLFTARHGHEFIAHPSARSSLMKGLPTLGKVRLMDVRPDNT